MIVVVLPIDYHTDGWIRLERYGGDQFTNQCHMASVWGKADISIHVNCIHVMVRHDGAIIGFFHADAILLR